MGMRFGGHPPVRRCVLPGFLLIITPEGMLIDARYSFTPVERERSETQDEESPVGLFRKPGWEQYHRNSGIIRANTDDRIPIGSGFYGNAAMGQARSFYRQ